MFFSYIKRNGFSKLGRPNAGAVLNFSFRVLKVASHDPFQRRCSVLGPLMASYKDLAIISKLGIHILQNPAITKKVLNCSFREIFLLI